MEAAGFGRARQFWAAVGTSAPQPVGALIAYLAGRTGQLPAAGLLRLRRGGDAERGRSRAPAEAYIHRGARSGLASGSLAGAGLMLALSLLLEV
jgi:hypothetical protein